MRSIRRTSDLIFYAAHAGVKIVVVVSYHFSGKMRCRTNRAKFVGVTTLHLFLDRDYVLFYILYLFSVKIRYPINSRQVCSCYSISF